MSDKQKTTKHDRPRLIDDLDMKYQEAVVLRFGGMREIQIAKELSVKYATVRQWFERNGICYAAYQELLKERARLNKKRVKKLEEQIQATLPEMVDVLYESGKRGNWMAAQSLLHIGGHQPVQKQEIKIDSPDKENVAESVKDLRKYVKSSTTPSDQEAA